MPITQFGSAMGLRVVRSGVQIRLLQRSEIRVLVLPSTPTPTFSSIVKGYYKQSIVLHSGYCTIYGEISTSDTALLQWAEGQLMLNTDSLEEKCYSDQVFETFPWQANPPVLLRWRFVNVFIKISHEQCLHKKKFIFFSTLIYSIWHSVLQFIVLSLKIYIEQRKPKSGFKRNRN